MVLGNSNLYSGLIYLLIGPVLLLSLKLISDSKFFKKGITVKYDDDFILQDRYFKAKFNLINTTLEAHTIPNINKSYRSMINKALYEEAVLAGRFKISSNVKDTLKLNNIVCLGDLTKEVLSIGKLFSIVVIGQNQMRRCKNLLCRPSKISSALILAMSLRSLNIGEFNFEGEVIKWQS
jgi:hypothetical protein